MVPLRILHVAPYAAAAWAYGGIPRVLGALTAALARRGHRVTVMATDACDDARRLRLDEAASPGVDVRLFANLSNGLAYRHQLFVPRGMAAALHALAGEVDVAHLHACHNLPGALAARALTRAGVPYVLQPNGTAPRIERRRLAKLLFDLGPGRRVLPGAARVLAVSAAEEAQLARLGVASGRIERLPNPVDCDEIERRPPAGSFRRRFGLGDGPLVVYLGQLTPRKRVDLLIDAVHHLDAPRVRLAVAGADLGAGPALRRRVARRGLGARVVFTGLLVGTERLAALADADIVVYPSQQEIFGLVPLEALGCGTPVLVADDCGCGEVAGPLGARVLPLGDVGALTRALGEVLADPAAARRAVAGAGESIRALYAPDAVAGRLEAIYRAVLAERDA